MPSTVGKIRTRFCGVGFEVLDGFGVLVNLNVGVFVCLGVFDGIGVGEFVSVGLRVEVLVAVEVDDGVGVDLRVFVDSLEGVGVSEGSIMVFFVIDGVNEICGVIPFVELATSSPKDLGVVEISCCNWLIDLLESNREINALMRRNNKRNITPVDNTPKESPKISPYL